MKTTTTLTALAAAILALGLSACGGGGNEDSAAGGGAAASGGGGKTITIDATDFAFSPGSVSIKTPGTYTFVVVNKGQAEHALQIDGPGLEQETDTVGAGETAEMTVELTQAGEYEIYCPVGEHRKLGMDGRVHVQS